MLVSRNAKVQKSIYTHLTLTQYGQSYPNKTEKTEHIICSFVTERKDNKETL